MRSILVMLLACAGMQACADGSSPGAEPDAESAGEADVAVAPDDAEGPADTPEAPDLNPPDLTDPTDTSKPATEPLCGQDRTAANVASLRFLGLETAVSVVAGTIGEKVERNPGEWYVPLLVETVYYGWTFLVGSESRIPLPKGMDLPAGSRVVVGLSQNHPAIWDIGGPSYWSNVTAMMPLSDAPAAGLGWRDAPLVAVVKITALDSHRATFEVVTKVRGEWPVTTFQDNWYAEWGAAYPAPDANFHYLASVSELGQYPAPGGGITYLGSILDFRPSSDELVARASAGVPKTDLAALVEERDQLHRAWRLKRSKNVVTGRVTGLASECCTGAGGTYIRYDRTEVLAGDAPPSFVLGGHGYYGTEACGDDYLVAPSAWSEGPLMGEPFSCEVHDGPDSMIPWELQLPATADVVAEVKAWLAGAPPLLQLHPEGAALPGAEPAADLPWARIRDASDAFSMATHISLIVVKAVDAVDGGHRVTLETTWSPYEYDHLVRYTVSLAFKCGDERLLEVGSRWLAPVVMLDPTFQGTPDPEQAFIIPGALVPEWALSDQLRNTLEQRL